MTLNLALLEAPSADNFPEEFDGTLDCYGLAICCSFNRHGALLAVGCNDGRIVIWDFLNRGVAKNIPAHAGHPVTALRFVLYLLIELSLKAFNRLTSSLSSLPTTSWSRNSHKLVSGSTDNSIAIWHVLTGECKIRFTYKAPILKVQFNPRNENIALVTPVKHPPILFEIDYDDGKMIPKDLPTEKEDTDANIVASFDRRGQYIYMGNARGRITIMRCPSKIDETTTLEIVSSFRVQPTGTTPSAIREIEFGARNKKYFLVNSSDRTIRLYNCENAIKAGLHGNCEEIRKFQDMVNKTIWKRCCISGDAEATHVCGASAGSSMYIWETENGTIKKMLQATKGESLLDIQWHPLKPILASICNGLVSIWVKPEIENWSAYAPHFKELEENEEYDERESEFDINDEDNPKGGPDRRAEEDDDEFVDIEGIKPEDFLVSSDEEGVDTKCLEFIPISIEEYEMVDNAQPH